MRKKNASSGPKSSGASGVSVVREARPQPNSRGKKEQPKNVSWFKIYEAAERADFKGFFFLPTLSPAEQLNFVTRRALYERVDYLYKNVGAVTMMIDGLALEEAGTGLWPKWTSSSPEYNKAMTDRYHYAAHDPRMFSADGNSDGYTAQFNIRRMNHLYGDSFGQFLRPAPGSTIPLLHLLPGWRIDNAKSPRSGQTPDGFKDGVRPNDLGRALEYQVMSTEFGGEPLIVPASDMLHFHDPFFPSQTRGVSCLATVAKKLFRREDILKAINNGTLARERLGFALQAKEGEESMGPSLEEIMGDGQAQTVTNPDGSTYTVARLFGDDADEKISIPKLPAGTEIKTIESNRPGTAVTEYLDLILREASWATLYPPEYLFSKSGMGQGTVARIVLQQVSAIVRARRAQQLIPQFCNRWHVFFAWQIIKSGTLGNIAIPDDWWKHKINGDADKSVDIGREGSLYDNRVATGKMSFDRYHALSGEDADDVEDEILARVKERIQKLNELNQDPAVIASGVPLQYTDIWPRSVNTPQPLQGQNQPGKPPEEN